jgi:predicted PurR-regulated permease PerM
VLVAVLIVILLLAVWEVHNTILLVMASIILVVLFTMPIRFLMKMKMPRGPATIISLLGMVATFIALILLVLPQLIDQFVTLGVEFQQGIEQVQVQWVEIENDPLRREAYPLIANIQDLLREVFGLTDLQQVINEITRQLGRAAGQLSGSVVPVVGGIASTLLSFLIVIFLSLYFLAEPHKYEAGVIKLFPIGYRHRVRFIIDRIDFTLRLWLQGQILLMVLVGILTWLGLALLGLEQALALGVLAGLFSFVPNFGTIAALVPALLVSLAQSPENLGWVALIIYGTSFIQSQIIAPLIFKESINLPPVLVLVGQIFAAVFLGFVGIMLAVPIIAILVILVQEVYIKDMLGDKAPELGQSHPEVLEPDPS